MTSKQATEEYKSTYSDEADYSDSKLGPKDVEESLVTKSECTTITMGDADTKTADYSIQSGNIDTATTPASPPAGDESFAPATPFISHNNPLSRDTAHEVDSQESRDPTAAADTLHEGDEKDCVVDDSASSIDASGILTPAETADGVKPDQAGTPSPPNRSDAEGLLKIKACLDELIHWGAMFLRNPYASSPESLFHIEIPMPPDEVLTPGSEIHTAMLDLHTAIQAYRGRKFHDPNCVPMDIMRNFHEATYQKFVRLRAREAKVGKDQMGDEKDEADWLKRTWGSVWHALRPEGYHYDWLDELY